MSHETDDVAYLPPGSIHVLPTPKTDAQLAAEYRSRMEAKLGELLDIMNEAKSHDIVISFQCGVNGFGRQFVTNLDLMKKL